jgi:hypothetical protein
MNTVATQVSEIGKPQNTLSLYQLLDPEILADRYPFSSNLASSGHCRHGAANREPERFDPNRYLTRMGQSACGVWLGRSLLFWSGARPHRKGSFRSPKLALEPGALSWRPNLGLRGLIALPVTF